MILCKFGKYIIIYVIKGSGVNKMAKMKNCAVCGRVFVDMSGSKNCRDCYQKERDMEEVVAKYVRDHQGASVEKICEETKVPEKIVLRMVKEGRFIESGIKISYPCEVCGAPITRGRFCDRCQNGIVKELQEKTARSAATQAQRTANRGSGMYSKDMGIK